MSLLKYQSPDVTTPHFMLLRHTCSYKSWMHKLLCHSNLERNWIFNWIRCSRGGETSMNQPNKAARASAELLQFNEEFNQFQATDIWLLFLFAEWNLSGNLRWHKHRQRGSLQWETHTVMNISNENFKPVCSNAAVCVLVLEATCYTLPYPIWEK